MDANEQAWTIWARGPSTGWSEPTQGYPAWETRDSGESGVQRLRKALESVHRRKGQRSDDSGG
jgi:hypothetical protein